MPPAAMALMDQLIQIDDVTERIEAALADAHAGGEGHPAGVADRWWLVPVPLPVRPGSIRRAPGLQCR